MKKLAIVALAAFALAACQSNQYKIQGSGSGLSEGDTLYLTSDLAMGVPSDTIVVKDGKFELTGETDSTYLCVIYSQAQNSATFFLEPGTIKIDFVGDGKSKVSGTKVNDAFQQMNDSVMGYNDRMEKIASVFSNDSITEEQQQSAMAEMKKVETEMSNFIMATTEKNLDNELGYFLITNYQDDNFTLEKKVALIDKLPAKMQQREDIKAIKDAAEAAQKTAIGKQMPEFTMNTPEGNPLNVMDEVKKNKITILDFWASWCGPCRAEMPFMKELYAKFNPKGLGIVGISLDEDGDAWKAAIKELGITWPQMSDLKGWKCEAGQMFQVNAIPFMAIVDENGTIIQKGLRGPELEQFISEKLK